MTIIIIKRIFKGSLKHFLEFLGISALGYLAAISTFSIDCSICPSILFSGHRYNKSYVPRRCRLMFFLASRQRIWTRRRIIQVDGDYISFISFYRRHFLVICILNNYEYHLGLNTFLVCVCVCVRCVYGVCVCVRVHFPKEISERINFWLDQIFQPA